MMWCIQMEIAVNPPRWPYADKYKTCRSPIIYAGSKVLKIKPLLGWLNANGNVEVSVTQSFLNDIVLCFLLSFLGNGPGKPPIWYVVVLPPASNGMYMSALAIVDTLFLYIRIIPQIVHFLRGDREITNAIICRVYFICVMYVDYLSAWLRFCFTMEKTLSVTLPHIYCVHFTRRITLIILVAASLILAAVNCAAIFILMFSDGICNMKVYAYIFSWIELVLSTILPFTGIIVNNSIMIYSLCKARRQRRVFS